MHSKIAKLITFVCTLLCLPAVSAKGTSSTTLSTSLPKWEVGIGSFAGYSPQYLGSEQNSLRVLALPYVIYRGDVISMKDGGLRAIAVKNEHLELDISIGGAFNANSDDNDARSGMPDIDFLFEIGPQLIIHLAEYFYEQGNTGKIDLKLQSRAVFSTDFSNINHRGFVFENKLEYAYNDSMRNKVGWKLSASALFATEKLHDLFYEVSPEFATPFRNAYNAKGGFLGTEVSARLTIPVSEQTRLFMGTGINYYGNSENARSPLLTSTLTGSAFLGLVWSFYQSN